MKHIPKRENTASYDILSFAEAWKLASQPQEAFDVESWIYVPPFYSEYRYVLGTKGKNPLIVIGVNPSTAAPDALDPTLKSAERIAHFNGYDSFWMLNVYPQRATNPNDVEKEQNDFLIKQNLAAFEKLLELSPSKDVWCAWGNIIEKRGFLKECTKLILGVADECGANLLQAEKTCKSKNPHHPLYLKSDTKLITFVPKSLKVSIC